MCTCHLLSLNVRGLRNKEKRNQIFRWFKHQKADILFLQETYWSLDMENIVRNEWRGPCFFSHGSTHSCGVAILFQPNLVIEQVEVKYTKDGRLLIMCLKIQNVSIALVNVYAPTQRKYRDNFFNSLYQVIEKQCLGVDSRNFEIILGGDWNCVLNVKKDVYGTENSYYGKQRYLAKIIKKYSLYDIWRKIHPKTKQFTWRNMSLKRASRLDFWLVDKNIYKKSISADI